MDPSISTFRISNYKPIETRTRHRPKLRWADVWRTILKVLKASNWRTVAKSGDRNERVFLRSITILKNTAFRCGKVLVQRPFQVLERDCVRKLTQNLKSEDSVNPSRSRSREKVLQS
ncbi:hypothetical protein TNCV_2840731 [Trichonephila clavipes]|uniref:Uncharacterized protein n=1 Tax=Trichonephila clavipes TaxID=2585209 RepID=A0A8X6V352_TRICX|nr:hypothetical protein TNCV_2840731 [Trichonephila clavipes]